jgi:hypothetical protein
LKGRKPWRKEANPGDFAAAKAINTLITWSRLRLLGLDLGGMRFLELTETVSNKQKIEPFRAHEN